MLEDICSKKAKVLGSVDICSTTNTMPTFRGLTAESMDPADRPRGVGLRMIGLRMNCQQTILLLVGLIGLTFSSLLFALPTDRQQLAQLNADRVDFNVQAHLGIYQGNVHFIQGSSHLEAQEARTQFDEKNQLNYAIAQAHAPSRAHFWTQPEQDAEIVHGFAQCIEYFPTKHLVILKGNAALTQGKNTLNAPVIHFDLYSHHLSTQTGQGSRTHIEFYQEKPHE